MNVLIWHVHGSWTTSFVHGPHTYLVPVLPDRGADGRGRARTWNWPDNVVEVCPEALADAPIDVVVVQRPHEVDLARQWTGRRPGIDNGLVWLEHNAPPAPTAGARHPAADRDDVLLVHVTHTNDLLWDAGSTPTRVVEHGIPDPGSQWTGDTVSAAVAVNEPVRRGRVVGTDLLPRFAAAAPVDVFGMGTSELAASLGYPGWLTVVDDPPQRVFHAEMAARRCYLHPYRWTSLGLALIEAMMLGMPVVALATTEVPMSVPSTCGFVSNDISELTDALRTLMADHAHAARLGAAGREHALARFGLDRFVRQWDDVLKESCR